MLRIRRKYKNLIINILTFLVSSLLFLIVLEIVFVVFHPIPKYGMPEGVFVANPIYDYGFKPNFSGQHNSVDFFSNFTINSLSLRDKPDLTYDSTQETVLFLGDSVAEGYGVNDDQNIPRNFEETIKSKYRVVNAAVRGYSTRHAINYYNTEGYKFDPKYVIMVFVSNDLEGNVGTVEIYRGFHFFDTNVSTKTKIFTKIFINLRKLNLFRFLYYDLYVNRKIFDFNASNNAKIDIANKDGLFDVYEQYISGFNNELLTQNRTLIVVTVPWLKPYQEEGSYENSEGEIKINNKVIEIFKKYNISYFDLKEDIKANQNATDMYFKYVDGHFNAKGNKIIGQAIAKRFIEWEKTNHS